MVISGRMCFIVAIVTHVPSYFLQHWKTTDDVTRILLNLVVEVVSVLEKLLFLKDGRVDLPMCRCKDVVTFQPPEISLFVHGDTFHQ